MKEYLKEQLERTNYWLSFSEAKNGALVAVKYCSYGSLYTSQ